MTASDLVTDTSVEKPDEWPMRTAASFNPFITSGSRGWAKYYADHGDLFMRITNLKRHRIKPDLSDRQHVALPASEKEGLRTGLRHGDILISITADIGIIGYVDETVPTPAYINQHVACLRLPADQVSPKFVAYYLASSEPQRRFIEMTDVGAKTGINLTTVGKLTFPCPPLAEQEAIAEALSDADALIEGLERLISKKRLIKQGAMQDLLTAKRRLPGFSGEWITTRLGEIGKFKNGINKPTDAFGSGFPFVNLADVFGVTSIFDSSTLGLVETTSIERRVYDVCSGDVLFIRSSVKPSGVGLTALVEKDLHDAVFSGFILRFRDSGQLTNAYKRHCFHEASFRASVIASSTVSANTNINQTALRALEITYPASNEEQNAIGGVLSDMDAEIQALDTRLEKARQVKEGMMQNLLTGRIRLV